MLTAYCWNGETKCGDWLSADKLEAAKEALRDGPCVLWIDLEDPTEEEEALVYERFFRVHPLTREDVTRLRRDPKGRAHFPKVEEFPDYLFVVVNPLAQKYADAVAGKQAKPEDVEERASTQLSAVLTERALITHHYEPTASTKALRAFLDKHQMQAGRGPDYLFHIVLDAMVDQYAPVLDHFDGTLDALEERVFRQPKPELLAEIHRVKREIITLRKTLVYEREVLARLARGEFDLIDEREMVYYRNVYDHLVRFTELIESSREMVTDLMQTHLAATANHLNQIMKGLTVVSTIVLPMTLITGIYGMNFEEMPEIKWLYGYPFALAVMVLFGVGTFLFYKWQKWI